MTVRENRTLGRGIHRFRAEVILVNNLGEQTAKRLNRGDHNFITLNG